MEIELGLYRTLDGSDFSAPFDLSLELGTLLFRGYENVTGRGLRYWGLPFWSRLLGIWMVRA